jgi:hypothetical protein
MILPCSKASKTVQFPIAIKYKKLLTAVYAYYCFFVRPAYHRCDVSFNNASRAILQRRKNVHYLLAPQLNCLRLDTHVHLHEVGIGG